MARGPSGRLVVDLDPALKRELHAALAADGTTFKEWLIARVSEYFDQRRQPSLPGIIRYPAAKEEPALRVAEDAPQTASPRNPKP